MEKVQVIPVSGVEEIGINCTVIRYADKIIVIDVGLGFSDVDHLGVDYLIPNYDYLKNNKEKIEGIFITHGHLDHIGAVEYFLKELDYPDLFAPRFALELIKRRLEEAKILDKAKLHAVDERSSLKNGELTVEYFRVNHSIPDSYGVAVRTPVGTIVHTGDFKFDNSPLNEPVADYLKMATLGAEGVKLLLSDSTNSGRSGHSISERTIMGALSDVVKAAPGRVIVATFGSLITRLYALVEIAKITKRKIFITGRSMHTAIEIARKLGYINATDDMFITPNNVKRFADSNLMVLSTGSQGENMSALARMSRGEHRDLTLKKGDTVVLSSSIIPGNDSMVQILIDELSRIGVKIINNDMTNLHTSGHGFIEDQKLMLNLIKPELFMPVHGYQYFLGQHAETAIVTGVKRENTIIAKRGEIIEISESGWKSAGRIKHEPLLVSGLGVGDIGPLLLQDREKLAANGVLMVSLVVKGSHNKGRELYKDPSVYSRGFVFVKENMELMRKITDKAKSVFAKYKDVEDKFIPSLRQNLEKELSVLIYNLAKREPLILVNIEIIELPGGRKPKLLDAAAIEI